MSLDVYLECECCESELFYANITHNLGAMAREAGVYLVCWSPAELDPGLGAKIRAQCEARNFHGAGGVYELEASRVVRASELIEPPRSGVALMRSDPERFVKYDSPNGWGVYRDFLPWLDKYLAACEEHPNAVVRVSR